MPVYLRHLLLVDALGVDSLLEPFHNVQLPLEYLLANWPVSIDEELKELRKSLEIKVVHQ